MVDVPKTFGVPKTFKKFNPDLLVRHLYLRKSKYPVQVRLPDISGIQVFRFRFRFR